MPGNLITAITEEDREGRQFFFYVLEQCILNTLDVQDKRRALNSPVTTTECLLHVRHCAGNEESCTHAGELISTDQSLTHSGKACELRTCSKGNIRKEPFE